MKRHRRPQVSIPSRKLIEPNDEDKAKIALEAEQQKRADRCLTRINEALRLERCVIEASAVIQFDGSAPRLLWTTKALP